MFILYLKRFVIPLTAILFLIIMVSCEEDNPSEPNNNTQTITISGFVEDADGEPVAGVSVIIKGKAPVTTNANGGFTVSNVSKPYEARVILSTAQSAIVYQGLTRSDPTLLYLSAPTSWKTAQVSGSVPPAAGKVTLVFFISGTLSSSVTADEVTGLYDLTVNWKGGANSVTGNVYVLRYTQNTNGMPAQYDAYGLENNLTVSAGGNFDNHNFTVGDLTDPPEQNISGTVVRPSSSYELFDKTLYLTFGSAEVYLGGESAVTLSDNFSYVVPSITGATFGVNIWAALNATPNQRYTIYWKRGITAGSSGITITLSSAPQLNIPAHNGSGVDTTTQFLWTMGSGGGICYLLIQPNNPADGPLYYIFTGGNTTTIPNLAPQGLGLPSNKGYNWNVIQLFPVASMDEAASSTFLQQTFGKIEGGEATSEQFNFTTKTIP